MRWHRWLELEQTSRDGEGQGGLVCCSPWAYRVGHDWHYLAAAAAACWLSRWCYITISSSVAPFSFCLQSSPASGSFPGSWLFASDGQSIGDLALASVLPMNIQGWFPLELPGLISLLSKGLSNVFFSTTFLKHQFFMVNRKGKSGRSSDRFYFLGFQNHYGWWLQPWN